MLIEFGIVGRSATTTSHIVIDKIEKWSERYQIAIKIKFRKNTIIL